MSSETIPISPTRFATALKDLPLSSLHLKAAEIRNSIAHLDYSNEQLKPFAEGLEGSSDGQPDQDCIDAINENCIVIDRMKERLALLKVEVESRGGNWLEFQSTEELADSDVSLPNGSGEEGNPRSEAWRDGTFQTGRVVNGEVIMDGQDQTNGTPARPPGNAGGRLDDDTLRREMEARMREFSEEADGEGGMHL